MAVKKPTGLDKAAAALLAPPQSPDEIGRLEKYRVLKVLGKGGMGMVFKAEDPSLERTVALKVMLPEIAIRGSARERFLREARAAAKIEHEHIISIFEVSEDRGIPFIAMSFLKGMSLDDWLKHKPPLAMPQIFRIGREVAKGLQAAHERGLIHRDIKPANLWLDAASKGKIKILDFGLARPETDDAGITRSGQIIGTPAYMSPEQAAGEKLDGRSDLFSLGVVLYRLCTGKMPFQGPNVMAILAALITTEPEPVAGLNPDVPPALATLIHRLLAKKKEDRPASAREIVDAIAAIERERFLKKLGAEVTSASITSGHDAESPRGAVSQTFNFEESAESQITDDDFASPTNSAPPPDDEPGPRWLWPAILGSAAALLIAVAAGIFAMGWGGRAEPASEGIVELLGNDKNVQVHLERDGQAAALLSSTERQAKLPPGRYRAWLDGNANLILDPAAFDLKKDGRVSLSLSPRPQPKPNPPPIKPTPPKDPPKDAFAAFNGSLILQGGDWNLSQPGAAQSGYGNDKAGIRIPVDAVPAEYRLELEVNVFGERGNVSITFPAGGRLSTIWLESDLGGGTPRVSALECIDGKSLTNPGNPTRTPVAVFRRNQPVPVVLTVRDGRVTLEADGNTIIDWSGDFKRLSPSQYWNWGNNKGLALGTRTSAVRFSKVRVTPLNAGNLAVPATSGNSALEFDGKSYIYVPNLGSSEFRPLTLEAWVRPAGTVNDFQEVLDAFGPYRVFLLRHLKNWVAQDRDMNTHKANSVVQGQWTHLAVVLDAKELSLYLDGKRAYRQGRPDASKKVESVPAFWIGGRLGLGQPPIDKSAKVVLGFEGAIAGVRYSRVTRYAADFTPDRRFVPDADTLALYHFDEGRGEVLKDSSGNGHDGTIVGAKWVRRDDASVKFTNSLGMEFALIPRGKSWLGGGGGSPPTRQVEFNEDFYLGVYEVTQEEWQKVMGKNPSNYSRNGKHKDRVQDISDADLKRFPVENVSWLDCQDFLAKLNEMVKEEGWTYRLSTLDQGQYACRGGPMADKADSVFHYYFATPTHTLTPNLANFDASNLKRPTKVGSYPANRLGIHDLHGNVREWCQDDRLSEKGELLRAYRTGCFSADALNSRATGWQHNNPDFHDGTYGLRVARVPVVSR